MSELILVFDDASYMALQASRMLEEVELDTESLGQLEVLFIVPGGAAEQMTLDDAMQRMRPHGGCDKIDILPSYDVLMAYNEKAVVCRGEDRFLTGPIIVIKDPADTALCKRILEMRMEPVQLGSRLCPAFRL